MHDDSGFVLPRVARFVRERLTPALHRVTVAATVEAWTAPGEPVPFGEAVGQEFRPFAPGEAWGRPWGTVWLHVTGAVPADWTAPELLVDLGFTGASPGFQAEGTVYSADGVVLGGLEPRRRAVPLGSPGVELYVEAAANPDVGGGWTWAPTPLGDLATAGDGLLYRRGRVDIAELDVEVWALAQDVWTLNGLVEALPGDLPRRAEVLRALERAVDAVDPDDVAGTAAAGRAALADVLARPAYASAHRVYAVGHAHIDSAWLWPVRETVRKVTRTFANVLQLMDADDDFVFAASSAQQYAWMRDHQPELFARIRKRAAEGRFVPVGGMWVESDTNMPGGEALARQFVFGAGFFRDELGVESDGVWLPDSFGYSAALPQIAVAAGRRWLLTQKISWNDTNRFPHHTFAWEGIDGTRIRTHFPPVDTYNAELSGAELARAQRQFAEKGRANTSLVPFGWGDGGGGPTREMLAAAHRTRDLEGSPTVRLARPSEFFAAAEAEYPAPPVWSGELYLEYHRGTYTTQARTKRGNRRSEHLLREAELWASTATVQTGAPYPADVLLRCWETVLLQQFHDILPGTSIAWVHRQAEREYARVAEDLEAVIAEALAALTGPGDREIAANAGPYAVDGIPALGAATAAADGYGDGDGDGEEPAQGPDQDLTAEDHPAGDQPAADHPAADHPASGHPATDHPASGHPATDHPEAEHPAADHPASDHPARDRMLRRPVEARATAGYGAAPLHGTDGRAETVLTTDELRVVIDDRGLITSIVDRVADRELVAPGHAANLLQLHRDTPTYWDAWDIDAHYRRHGVDLVDGEVSRVADGVRSVRTVGASTITQTVALRGRTVEIDTHVDWHERQKLLKLAFGLDLLADRAASEIQFGHVHRPTHTNTSWDAARFETCAHRWVHVGEPGYGVAVANDATYGHDITREGPTTTVRLSLLRAPLFPDPEADQGEHRFRVALLAGATIGDAVAEGYRLNLPVRRVRGGNDVAPLIVVADPAVVVEAVKLAEDGSGDVVVRLYEAFGTRASTRITPTFEHLSVTETDLLETPLPAAVALDGDRLHVRPFQIVTLRFVTR